MLLFKDTTYLLLSQRHIMGKRIIVSESDREHINSLYEIKSVSKNRLVLNFPNYNNWERVGSKIAKSLDLVTNRFASVDKANRWLNNNHHSLSKPLDTLIFGTHGSKDFGSVTMENNEFDMFKTVKSHGLVGGSTLIFFTACEGALKPFKLMEIANYFGVPVYAAGGTYNYVTNSADIFIKVDPQDMSKPVSEWNENNPDYEPDGGPLRFRHGDEQLKFALRRGYVTEIPSSPIKWL